MLAPPQMCLWLLKALEWKEVLFQQKLLVKDPCIDISKSSPSSYPRFCLQGKLSPQQDKSDFNGKFQIGHLKFKKPFGNKQRL